MAHNSWMTVPAITSNLYFHAHRVDSLHAVNTAQQKSQWRNAWEGYLVAKSLTGRKKPLWLEPVCLEDCFYSAFLTRLWSTEALCSIHISAKQRRLLKESILQGLYFPLKKSRLWENLCCLNAHFLSRLQNWLFQQPLGYKQSRWEGVFRFVLFGVFCLLCGKMYRKFWLLDWLVRIFNDGWEKEVTIL